ncbi:hypothetical protein [Tenacibaculum aquimarinum]|jgi:hypothetical protein|uniref:hypothetical protein n=1 Tax=Tenacibaculum aquimarinum TaxID=2910675 RepID=UPI001F0A8E4E|nr:hypothetical protein [Tenacibaculum aquimarinum]MCH3886005.1 hypothetical protein [Tenacibaculum aquimarinum]
MAIIERIRTIHPDGRVTVKETIDNDKITVNKKQKLGGFSDFIFVFQNAILEVLKSANLGKNSYKILLYLMAKTEFEKEINATLYGIAKELKIDQSQASKAMKSLTDLNIVIRNKELRTFRLNYEIGFKGSPKNYKKLQYKDKPILELQPNSQTSILDKDQQIKEIDITQTS